MTVHTRSRMQRTALRVLFAVCVLAIITSMSWAGWHARERIFSASPPMSEANRPRTTFGIGAIGRLEPGWKMIQVGPPSTPDGARVEELAADEGDWVEAGQLVAIMDTRGRREATLIEAEAQVLVAAAKLAQIKFGPKPEDVAAQRAAVEHLKASLQKAEADYKRTEMIRATGAFSADEHDQRHYQVLLAKANLQQGEATLASLNVVRSVDVKVAEAELVRAEANVAKAKAELEAARIRAPISGRILKIHAWPGEKVGDAGIFEMGDTTQMHAVAEVYERDVPRVRVGQSAVVHVQSLPDKLAGEVIHIGWKVGRRVVLDNDPIKDTDARVVEVRVLLNSASSAAVAGLSNARVEVRIDTHEGR